MLRRYSLRTALVLVALIAVLMATFGRRYHQARNQRTALKELASLSATTGFTYDWQADGHVVPKSRPNYRDKPSRRQALRKLFGQDFTDNVVQVEVHQGDITDSDLAFLKAFPRLRTLELANLPITGACLQNVSRCKEMEVLLISFAPLEDEHLKFVKDFRRLEHLRLCFTNISDAGLAHIADMDRLRHVDLNSTKVSDKGLQYLSDKRDLETLILCETFVTDSGLPALYDLKKLQALTLKSDAFSERAIEELQAKLPRCRINFFSYPDPLK